MIIALKDESDAKDTEVVIANGNAARGINPAYPYYAEWTRMATDWTADPECVLLAARLQS